MKHGAHDTDFKAAVVERGFLGEFVRYRLKAEDAELIADQPHYAGDPGFLPGAEVRVGIDPAQIGLLAQEPAIPWPGGRWPRRPCR